MTDPLWRFVLKSTCEVDALTKDGLGSVDRVAYEAYEEKQRSHADRAAGHALFLHIGR